MALIKCPECSQEISTEATTCPTCGHPMKDARKPFKWLKRIVLGIFSAYLLVVIVSFISGWNSGVTSSKREKVTLFDKTTQLEEGMVWESSFKLLTTHYVTLNVTSTPEIVELVIMRKNEYEKYREHGGAIFGGLYEYHKGLSEKSFQNLNKSEFISAGEWVLRIVRPQKAILFGKSTAVNIRMTAVPKGR